MMSSTIVYKSLSEVENISDFNEAGDINDDPDELPIRKVCNFFMLDQHDQLISPLHQPPEGKYFTLKGDLVLPDSYQGSRPVEHVSFKVKCHYVHYGHFLNDRKHRGIFVVDEGGLQEYQLLEEPENEAYSSLLRRDYDTHDQFMRLFDALLFVDPSISQDDAKSGRYYCGLTIQEVHLKLNGYFNLLFVQRKKDFVIDCLSSHFVESKSKKLFNSIRKLTAKGNWIIPL